jgi:hypothetical protein
LINEVGGVKLERLEDDEMKLKTEMEMELALKMAMKR